MDLKCLRELQSVVQMFIVATVHMQELLVCFLSCLACSRRPAIFGDMHGTGEYLGVYFHGLTLGDSVHGLPRQSQICVRRPGEGTEWRLDPELQALPIP